MKCFVGSVVTLVAVLWCNVRVLTAQTVRSDTSSRAVPTNSNGGEWVAASLGGATYRIRHGDGAVVLTGDVDIQRGPSLSTLRGQFLFDFGETGALSLLLGRATTTSSVGFASVSGGVTAIARRPCIAGCELFGDVGTELGPLQGGVGVMIASDAALRVGHTAGGSIGLSAFVDLNTAKSYAGVGPRIRASAFSRFRRARCTRPASSWRASMCRPCTARWRRLNPSPLCLRP